MIDVDQLGLSSGKTTLIIVTTYMFKFTLQEGGTTGGKFWEE